MNLRNGKVCIFDLSSGESSEEDLEDAESWDKMSSVNTAKELMAKHGDNPLVLGTGIFTGSFVPAACAGILAAPSAELEHPRVMPILGFAGFELKLSGFDFIVLKGRAARPGYIWIRDGIVEFVGSEDMRGLDSWARTDRIRAGQGDGKIQVLAGGPWCDATSPASQLVIDHWGGEDKAGLGAELGKRGLQAIAFRGMGELELEEPEGHFEEAVLTMREHIEKLGKNEGLLSYTSVVDREDFRSLVHRHVSCYGCPFPCRTYLKTGEDPKEMRLVVKEPGYLHYDIPALNKAFELGLSAKDATAALMLCARAGAEPVSVLSAAAATDAKASVETVRSVLAKPESVTSVGATDFEASLSTLDEYLECLGLGLCPRYWAKVGFDMEAIGRFVDSALG